MSVWKKYGYLWITLILFLGSLVGHWMFGWATFVSEQQAHGQPVESADYINEMMRDTLENWQSEFLQLIWQVCGLAFLLFVGSPQSKEEDDRMEEKLDAILRRVAPAEADAEIERIDRRYPGREVGPGAVDQPGHVPDAREREKRWDMFWGGFILAAILAGVVLVLIQLAA